MHLAFETKDFQKISDIEIPSTFFNRMKTGDEYLDSIFGKDNSGILPGSTITLKAKPGVGKSVFSLGLAEKLTNNGYKVCYTSGEEDIHQLAYTCKRLNVQNLSIGTKTDVDEILEIIPNLDMMVIDSYQTLTTTKELSSREKNKYFIDNLVKQAKVHNCALMFIVQETTSGEIRGGTTLPYAVDVNMEILKSSEDKDLRIINIEKNRFGLSTCYEAKMSPEGYEFIGEYNLPELKSSHEKSSVKDVRKNTLLNLMDSSTQCTVESVMKLFDIKDQSAKILLSELEREMKFKKFGRGPTAHWILNEHDNVT